MTVLTRIDGPGCGCGSTAGEGGLIAVDAAIARIGANVRPVPATEEVPLAAAYGRILADPARERSAAPPFDNAAMDGFAIDTACLTGAGPRRLAVTDRIAAGRAVTGDEVNAPGQRRDAAGIWDVNTPILSALVATSATDTVQVAAGKDNRRALRRPLSDLASRVDLIVTTGGVFVGEEDHVTPAPRDPGATMVFSGVAMKPGKPVSFGRPGDAHWLGLPGNPLSAFAGWQLFGTVLCLALTGDTTPSSHRRQVVLSRKVHHKQGRCELRLAELSGFDGLGREIVHFDDATHSGRVARLARVGGVIVIPAEAENLPEGALVEFQPFCD